MVYNMKAITIWQPYAAAIRTGLKHYETRSWHTKYRGLLVIHAALKKPTAREKELIKKYRIPEKELEYGAPILLCKIVDCIQITEDFINKQPETEIEFGNWQVGNYAWKLKVVKKLNGYSKVKGQQGLWNIDLVKQLPFEESKDYLNNVANIHGNIVLHRTVYNDFCNNLDPDKTQNIFVGWCIQNYRDCLVLNLCKMLEPRKMDNKYTLRFFVEKSIENYTVIKEKMATARRVWSNGYKEDLSEIMLEKLNSINFAADRDRIDCMLAKIKTYRDKHLCHCDIDGVDVLPPEIKEMHQFVDELGEMIKKYFGIFRVAVCDDGITSLKYHDFTLHMP